MIKEAQITAAIEAILEQPQARDRQIIRDTMKAALEAAEKTAWQPIETAPKDGTGILLFNPYEDAWIAVGRHMDHIHPDFHYGWNVDHWIDDSKTTHWRPLPAAPQTEGG